MSTITPNEAVLRNYISLDISSQSFCIDMQLVREIRGWTPATSLPHTPHFVCGVINLRGDVVPVVDLSDLLGLGASQPSTRHVIVMVEHEEKIIGLLADVVTDIVVVEQEKIQPVPEDLNFGGGVAISGAVVMDGGEILRLLDLNAVISKNF